MKSTVAALALVLALPSSVFALAMETFGNAPAVKQPGWAEGVLDVVNLKSRAYSYWVNGNENFFYKGDARDLNEALRKYAGVKSDARRLILLPGRGEQRTFGGKTVAYDWKFHVPSGIYTAVTGKKHAELTVYVNAVKARGTPDRKQVAKWIAELDADEFETRQKAEQGLAKLGYDAKPMLRAALKGRLPLEARRRIERLLAKLPGFDVGDLEIPKGLTVVGMDDLLETHFKGLKDPNPNVCAQAAGALAGVAAYSDKVVPALTALLGKDRNEYVRRVAASCLARIGAAARPAVPALKAGLKDPDANIRHTFQAALDQIEKAKEQPGGKEEAQRNAAILKDIRELKKPAVTPKE